jgi:hypothetical protein
VIFDSEALERSCVLGNLKNIKLISTLALVQITPLKLKFGSPLIFINLVHFSSSFSNVKRFY